MPVTHQPQFSPNVVSATKQRGKPESLSQRSLRSNNVVKPNFDKQIEEEVAVLPQGAGQQANGALGLVASNEESKNTEAPVNPVKPVSSAVPKIALDKLRLLAETPTLITHGKRFTRHSSQ